MAMFWQHFDALYPNLGFSAAASQERRKLLAGLRHAFYCMENKAFLFSAAEGNPLHGWEELFSFVTAYDSFPDRYKLGPYYLVILPP